MQVIMKSHMDIINALHYFVLKFFFINWQIEFLATKKIYLSLYDDGLNL